MSQPPFDPDLSLRLDVLVPGADRTDLRRLRDDLSNMLKDALREKLAPFGEDVDYSVREIVSEPEPDLSA